MCLIFFSPKAGAKLEKERMESSLNRNDDAAGIMYVEDGRVVVEKTLGGVGNQADLVEWCFEQQEKHDRFIMHHRMSTDGRDELDNCHPFKVLSLDDGDPIDLYMMHNGVISNCSTSRQAERSDTRTYVEDYLTPMLKINPELLQCEAFQKHVGEFIGDYSSGSKLAFMDNTNKVTLINADLGQWYVDDEKEDLYWLSNTYSLNHTPAQKKYDDAYWGDDYSSHYPRTSFGGTKDKSSQDVVEAITKKKDSTSQSSVSKIPSNGNALTTLGSLASTKYANNRGLALATDMELWTQTNYHWPTLASDEIIDTLLESGFSSDNIGNVVMSLDEYSLTSLMESMLERIYDRDYA